MKFGPQMRPQMHNSMRRYDTVDDKHIMAKHSSLFPKQTSLKTLQKAISDTEKALKLAAEDLVKIGKSFSNWLNNKTYTTLYILLGEGFTACSVG